MSLTASLAGGARLVELLLEEQQRLSAVERFARRHEGGLDPGAGRSYAELIPTTGTPGPGQQLAFRVDLDACTGCKACVTACHNLNGLEADETWREVGLVVGGPEGRAESQTITTACHHCEDPACLAGCPVRAYEKDPLTGIVRHLDDQCIGCQYCILKCPYDVPRYSSSKGIVRKCDMCAGRLAVGEAPACVQGCPNSAITIEIVDQRGESEAPALVPGMDGSVPDSAYTKPTTRYVSGRQRTLLRPANLDQLRPAQAHDPLAIMLVLIQLSVGTFLWDAVLCATLPGALASRPERLLLATAAGVLGLAASLLHLGRPLYAFRSFLGWRTSWMSREILALGAFMAAAGAVLASAWMPRAGTLGLSMPQPVVDGWVALLPGLGLTAALLGTLGVYCSVMIYVDTRRELWSLGRTSARFFGTAVGLGAFAAALSTALLADETTSTSALAVLTSAGMLACAAKLGFELRFLDRRRRQRSATLERSVRLLRGQLRGWLAGRLVAGGAGGILLPSAFLARGTVDGATLLGTILVLTLIGELLERRLFFTAEASRGMPGL